MNAPQRGEVWLVDFEYGQEDGERPVPRCMVAREFRSGRLLRVWEDELLRMPEPPFDTGRSTYGRNCGQPVLLTAASGRHCEVRP